MESLGAARLTKEIPAQRAVATIVPREEIAAILRHPMPLPSCICGSPAVTRTTRRMSSR